MAEHVEKKVRKERPCLAYWDIRGLAQPIRYMLAYLQIDFEDKLYVDDKWFSEKFSLGLDFPNIPYYIDGDLKLSQSSTILRHLARKHDLYGSTDAEKDRIDLAHDQLVDFRIAFVELCYDPEYEQKKDKYLTKQRPPHLQQLEKFLGDGHFINGNKISFVDFLLFEVLDVNQKMTPNLYDHYPHLQAFIHRFEALPTLADAIKTARLLPANGNTAKFR